MQCGKGLFFKRPFVLSVSIFAEFSRHDLLVRNYYFPYNSVYGRCKLLYEAVERRQK